MATIARPTWAGAFLGCLVALALAAVVNVAIFFVAGDALDIPGELSVLHVAGFTLSAVPFAAVALRLLPRWFPLLAIVVAVVSAYAPYPEFGTPAAYWLAPMHVVAGVAAALIAPRFGVSRAARPA